MYIDWQSVDVSLKSEVPSLAIAGAGKMAFFSGKRRFLKKKKKKKTKKLREFLLNIRIF